MSRTRTLAAAALALPLLAGGAALAVDSAGGAAAKPVTHKITVHSVAKAGGQLGKTPYFSTVSEDRTGKRLIGTDVVSGHVDPSTGKVTVYGAIGLPGGLIYYTGHGSANSLKTTGTITGGTGAYAGAKGTIVSKQVPHQTKTTGTVVYTLP